LLLLLLLMLLLLLLLLTKQINPATFYATFAGNWG